MRMVVMRMTIMARVASQILSSELYFPLFHSPNPPAYISQTACLHFHLLFPSISSLSLSVFLPTPCLYFITLLACISSLSACISPPRPTLRLDFPLPLAFLQLRRALFTNSSLPLSFPSPPTISRLDKFKKIHRQQFLRRTQVHCIQS